MTNIILASASPRRKQILKDAGIEFRIEKSNFEEKLEDSIFSQEKIEQIAFKKGQEVATRFTDDIVISADTVVVLNNNIFTKPKDHQNAISMLKQLSGKEHFVQTSVCIIYKNKKNIVSTKTFVTFNELSDDMIINYVKTFNPIDKAGAYGIQELPKSFIKNINGDLENVIGISSTVVTDMLRNINI